MEKLIQWSFILSLLIFTQVLSNYVERVNSKLRWSYTFIKKIYNFEVMSLLFQIEDIILINKWLIASKHLWNFLKFETKLKFPSISATSVTFYLPNFIPFLFPFSSFFSSSYSIAIFILPHSILFLSSLRQLASPSMDSCPFYSNMCKRCAWLPPPSTREFPRRFPYCVFARSIV